MINMESRNENLEENIDRTNNDQEETRFPVL